MEIAISLALTRLGAGGGEAIPNNALFTVDNEAFLTSDDEYFIVAAEA